MAQRNQADGGEGGISQAQLDALNLEQLREAKRIGVMKRSENMLAIGISVAKRQPADERDFSAVEERNEEISARIEQIKAEIARREKAAEQARQARAAAGELTNGAEQAHDTERGELDEDATKDVNTARTQGSATVADDSVSGMMEHL